MGRGALQRILGVAACLAAAACYEAAPPRPAYNPKLEALDLAEAALIAVERGHTAEALRLLDEAIAIDPGYAAPHQDRALLLAQLGRNEEAIAALDDAMARGADPGEPLLAKGILLEIAGRADEAKAAYAAASEALAQPAPDPAQDLRRRIAWAHAEYLHRGMPAGVRAITEVMTRYPGHPVAERYRVRMLANRRETLLVMPFQPAGTPGGEPLHQDQEE